jgi:hypothetical protein
MVGVHTLGLSDLQQSRQQSNEDAALVKVNRAHNLGDDGQRQVRTLSLHYPDVVCGKQPYVHDRAQVGTLVGDDRAAEHLVESVLGGRFR